jgi:hypothetical protein
MLHTHIQEVSVSNKKHYEVRWRRSVDDKWNCEDLHDSFEEAFAQRNYLKQQYEKINGSNTST